MKRLARVLMLFAAVCMAAGCASVRMKDGRDGFVSLAEAVPDAILEIRYYSTYNFVGERIDGYEQPCALISKKAAVALKAASDDAVRRGYRLKIYDAYRPQRMRMSNGQNTCRGLVEGRRCVDHRYRHIELGDEGRTPPTVGSQLLDIISKTATVPIRIEKTETKDGKVRWQPLGYKPWQS